MPAAASVLRQRAVPVRDDRDADAGAVAAPSSSGATSAKTRNAIESIRSAAAAAGSASMPSSAQDDRGAARAQLGEAWPRRRPRGSGRRSRPSRRGRPAPRRPPTPRRPGAGAASGAGAGTAGRCRSASRTRPGAPRRSGSRDVQRGVQQVRQREHLGHRPRAGVARARRRRRARSGARARRAASGSPCCAAARRGSRRGRRPRGRPAAPPPAGARPGTACPARRPAATFVPPASASSRAAVLARIDRVEEALVDEHGHGRRAGERRREPCAGRPACAAPRRGRRSASPVIAADLVDVVLDAGHRRRCRRRTPARPTRARALRPRPRQVLFGARTRSGRSLRSRATFGDRPPRPRRAAAAAPPPGTARARSRRRPHAPAPTAKAASVSPGSSDTTRRGCDCTVTRRPSAVGDPLRERRQRRRSAPA